MAEWFSCKVQIAGYVAGETDFTTRIARLIQAERDYLTRLVERIATVETDPAACMAITTLGFSDRVDEAALTVEQRRAKEDAAAQERAESASTWLKGQLTARFVGTSFNGLPAAEWRGIAATKAGCGASNLKHPSPGANESLRKQNRRVEIYIYSYLVPDFPVNQELMELG